MYKSHHDSSFSRLVCDIHYSTRGFSMSTCSEISIPLNTYHHGLTLITSCITTRAFDLRGSSDLYLYKLLRHTAGPSRL